MSGSQQPTAAQLKSIDDSAAILANDNVEICANYIQKLAVERVGAEMDKKLAPVSISVYAF